MGDLDELQKRVIAFRDERNWKQFHSPKNEAMSLVSEAVELLDEFKWMTDAEVEEHIANNRDAIADEVIDVLVNVLMIAHDLDLDIKKEFDRKMKINMAKYPVEKAKNTHKKYNKL